MAVVPPNCIYYHVRIRNKFVAYYPEKLLPYLSISEYCTMGDSVDGFSPLHLVNQGKRQVTVCRRQSLNFRFIYDILLPVKINSYLYRNANVKCG